MSLFLVTATVTTDNDSLLLRKSVWGGFMNYGRSGCLKRRTKGHIDLW